MTSTLFERPCPPDYGESSPRPLCPVVVRNEILCLSGTLVLTLRGRRRQDAARQTPPAVHPVAPRPPRRSPRCPPLPDTRRGRSRPHAGRRSHHRDVAARLKVLPAPPPPRVVVRNAAPAPAAPPPAPAAPPRVVFPPVIPPPVIQWPIPRLPPILQPPRGPRSGHGGSDWQRRRRQPRQWRQRRRRR